MFRIARERRHALCCLVGLLLCGVFADARAEDKPAAGAPAATENKVYLDRWTYSRERKTITGSNRVTARFTLKNAAAENLEDVRVEVTLLSGLGEKVGGPLAKTLGTLKPKEVKTVEVSAEFIPVFGSYEILVTHRAGKERWFGSSDVTNPQPRFEGPAENAASVVLLGEESCPDRANRLTGTVRVKNDGKLEAKNLKLTVIYYASAAVPGPKKGQAVRAKVGEWSGPLGNGRLPGGAERKISFAVPTPMPRNASNYELKVNWDETPAEQQISGGEFLNHKDLEAAHWKFKRTGPQGQDLEVACDVRNGLSLAVEGAKLTLTFYATNKGEKKLVKSHTQEVPGPLEAGQVQPVSFTLAQVLPYDTYEQAWEYGKGGGGSPAKAKEPAFKNDATVEVLFKNLTTQEDGTVQLICEARNGRPQSVKEVVVKVHFFDGSGKELCVAEKTLPDPIAKGDVRNFIMRAPGAKGYATYTSEIKFQEFKPEAPATPAEPVAGP